MLHPLVGCRAISARPSERSVYSNAFFPANYYLNACLLFTQSHTGESYTTLFRPCFEPVNYSRHGRCLLCHRVVLVSGDLALSSGPARHCVVEDAMLILHF